jgi:deazaflavin-dependent oxidoreductase (nitroreductase family)
MKSVLRSRIHGMVSKTILLITYTGRKSGKSYTTPVSYSQSGDQVFIFTHADWWKNLLSKPQVTLHLQGREVQGVAEPVAEDKEAVATGLVEHLRKVPTDASFYGLKLDEHENLKAGEVEKAVQTVVMIRIRLC